MTIIAESKTFRVNEFDSVDNYKYCLCAKATAYDYIWLTDENLIELYNLLEDYFNGI
jgi:hypothetical protein